MSDWAQIAAARGLTLGAPELQRISDALNGLEQAFRPLVGQLNAEMEPDVELRLDGERE